MFARAPRCALSGCRATGDWRRIGHTHASACSSGRACTRRPRSCTACTRPAGTVDRGSGSRRHPFRLEVLRRRLLSTARALAEEAALPEVIRQSCRIPTKVVPSKHCSLDPHCRVCRCDIIVYVQFIPCVWDTSCTAGYTGVPTLALLDAASSSSAGDQAGTVDGAASDLRPNVIREPEPT